MIRRLLVVDGKLRPPPSYGSSYIGIWRWRRVSQGRCIQSKRRKQLWRHLKPQSTFWRSRIHDRNDQCRPTSQFSLYKEDTKARGHPNLGVEGTDKEHLRSHRQESIDSIEYSIYRYSQQSCWEWYQCRPELSWCSSWLQRPGSYLSWRWFGPYLAGH